MKVPHGWAGGVFVSIARPFSNLRRPAPIQFRERAQLRRKQGKPQSSQLPGVVVL